MAKVEHYYTQFEDGKLYHIFNRTVDRKPMFTKNANYLYFLNQFNKYLAEYLTLYAFCLLDNHFHLLVKINELQDLTTFKKLSNLNGKTTHELVSHQFKKFFQSYSMAFNKQENRIGTLFQTPFKRVKIKNECLLKEITCYIHINPELHLNTTNFKKWNWSSYQRIFTNKETNIISEEIFKIFQGLENYIETHEEYLKNMQIGEKDFYIED